MTTVYVYVMNTMADWEIGYCLAMDTVMTLAMADFTMKYICPMQERLLLRNGRL